MVTGSSCATQAIVSHRRPNEVADLAVPQGAKPCSRTMNAMRSADHP